MKVREYSGISDCQCEKRSGWKRKKARGAKEERNIRFIVAGFDTGANGVLNDVIGS